LCEPRLVLRHRGALSERYRALELEPLLAAARSGLLQGSRSSGTGERYPGSELESRANRRAGSVKRKMHARGHNGEGSTGGVRQDDAR